MRKFIRRAFLVLTSTPEAVAAQDYGDGADAYNAGDYTTAFRKFRPLAEQGDAIAQGLLGVTRLRG